MVLSAKIFQSTFFISNKTILMNILSQAKIDGYFSNAKSGSIFIDNYLVDSIQELIKTDYKIKRAWIYHMEEKTDLVAHSHDFIVGVYYLQVNENSGALYFENLNETIEPQNGMFVIIPAKEKHSILENKSKEFRVSLCMELIKN